MKYLCFLALLCSACSQPVDKCKAFRTGTFLLEDGKNIYKIVRAEQEQSEKDLTTGDTASYKVSWVDDCTYKLTLIKMSRPNPMNITKLTVSIIKIVGEYAYYESRIEGLGVVLPGRMKKTK